MAVIASQHLGLRDGPQLDLITIEGFVVLRKQGSYVCRPVLVVRS